MTLEQRITALAQAIAGVVKLKADVPTRKSALIMETDFYNVTSPFAQGLTGAAISAGTLAAVAGTKEHPGIVYLRDSTTANGGYRISTAANAILLGGGEKSVISFQVKSARTTANSWLAFCDNSTNAQPVDGAYLYTVGNGTNATISARCRNNNAETIAATTFTASLNTWYTAIVEVNANATAVDFSIYSAADVLLFSESIATNIPVTTGRETGWGVQSNESSTDAAADILWVDYMRFEINRALVR
jgi:hypothetical protein